MRFFLFLTLILFSSIIYAQDFPEERVELLLGKIVKPKSIEESFQKYAYKNFYSVFNIEEKKLEKFEKSHRIFPISATKSDYASLVGEEFKVINVFEQSVIFSSDVGRYSVLELEHERLGIVYYDYDSKNVFSFELEVDGGLELPEGFYCKDIEITVDKFTGERTESLGYSEGYKFIKTTKEGKSIIYLAINVPGATLNIGKKGLTLLLTNNKIIQRPDAKIDVKAVKRGRYVYSAFIALTDEEIDLIINNQITYKRLYIYDDETERGYKLSEYLKCLTKTQ